MKKMAVVLVFLAAFATCAPAQARNSDPRSVYEAYVAAWNNHDLAAVDRLIAADGVHEDIPNAVHAKGPQQVKEFMKSIIAMEPDYKWHVDRVIVSGSTIVAEWTWTATFTGDGPYGPAKNVPVSGRGTSVVDIENGRIKQFTDYYDTLTFFPKPAAKS